MLKSSTILLMTTLNRGSHCMIIVISELATPEAVRTLAHLVGVAEMGGGGDLGGVPHTAFRRGTSWWSVPSLTRPTSHKRGMGRESLRISWGNRKSGNSDVIAKHRYPLNIGKNYRCREKYRLLYAASGERSDQDRQKQCMSAKWITHPQK